MFPNVRQSRYIPFFVTERKRIQVVQEAFVQGVSTRKMEKLAQSLGIENLSRSQVSEITKGLNKQVKLSVWQCLLCAERIKMVVDISLQLSLSIAKESRSSYGILF